MIFCSAPVSAEEPKVLIIFTPECSDTELAAKLADRMWRKINRNRKEDEFIMIDLLTIQDIEDGLPGGIVSFDSTPAEVTAILREKFDAHVGVWGKLDAVPGNVEFKLRAIDLTVAADRLWLDETLRAEGERAAPIVIDKAAELILERPTWKPEFAPAPDEPEPPEAGPLVNKNPEFEQGSGDKPVGWERVNGLGTFWVELGDGRGKGIRFDTAIPEGEYLAWLKKWKDGAPAKNAPKKSKHDTSYGAIGGTYGVHFYSDYYPIKPGMRYRISADSKGGGGDFFFPKIFVKGYVKMTDKFGKEAWRMVYETYLSCRIGKDKWRHYWLRFNPYRALGKIPIKKLHRPTHVRILLYCYWPPGEYFFNNVRLTEDPE
jgi:hypothetical protein